MGKKVPALIVLTILLIIFVLGAYLSFNRSFTEHLQDNASVRLQEIAAPNIVSFDLQVKEQIKKVKTLADILAHEDSLNTVRQRELLEITVKNNNLLRCTIVFPDGNFITHDNSSAGNLYGDEFFSANMRGECYITDPRPALVDSSKTVMFFTAPINKDGKIIGSVIYSYLCDDMDSIFNLSFLEEQGKMLVMKKSGERLIGHTKFFPSDVNIVNYIREHCTHQRHAKNDCFSTEGDSDSYIITLDNIEQPLIVNYDKLNFNDWYMISMVPENAAVQTFSSIVKEQRNYGVFIAICLLIYLNILLGIWFISNGNKDKMTGLLNTAGFKRSAKKLLSQNPGTKYVFVKLDIKNFKLINRMYDFNVGNQVIKNVSLALQWLLQGLPATLCRSGTDDFILMLPYDGRAKLDEQRMSFIVKFKELMGKDFTTSVEFPTGQYLLTDKDYIDPDVSEFLEKVNFAHKAAKQKDYSIVVDYAQNIEKIALITKNIEDRMAGALANGEFKMFLQPKFRVADEQICGAEALVRWQNPDGSFMSPADFIPVLERNGFVVKIDMQMFEQAAKWIKQHMEAGYEPINISVNFSRLHLYNDSFVSDLCELADKYEVPHKYLEIELTESAVFENLDRIKNLLAQLHAVGFGLAMDDFGSGYSSLTLLKDLSVDVIKLDKGFFDAHSDMDRTRVVLANIMHMAKDLRAVTVAEGIESLEYVELLRGLGCDIIQGFYYSKPIPAEELDMNNPYSYNQKYEGR